MPHQCCIVSNGPVFRALAIDHPDHVHLLVGEAAAGRGQAEELAGVPTTVSALDNGGVALGDHAVDCPLLTGKSN